MSLKDHELKVKLKGSNTEIVVSKSYYLKYPDQYEVVEGDAPEVETTTFEPPPLPAVATVVTQKKTEVAADGQTTVDTGTTTAPAPATPKAPVAKTTAAKKPAAKKPAAKKTPVKK